MHSPSKTKQELIAEKAEPKRKQTEAALPLQGREQNYRLMATYHKQLNNISIDFTEASGMEALFSRIAESFRLLTNAIATTFSIYNYETRVLRFVSLSIDPLLRVKVDAIFGPELSELRMPVSADDMKHMLSQGIRRPKDLYELSFGKVPQDISDAIMDAIGCRQIIALAISYGEELIGTCVAYLPENQPVVPDDALKTYTYLAGLAVNRRRMEDALRESEAKYRLIAENTADVISILDMNLRFTYISPAIMRLRGFTVEEAMGQSLNQILTPESMQFCLAAFEAAMQREASGKADPDRIRLLELEQYKKDGSTIWVEASLFLLRDEDNKPVGVLTVSRDITERKQADTEIRSSREQMRSLARHLQSVREMERKRIARELHDELGGALTGMKIDFSLLKKSVLEAKQDTVRASVLAGMNPMMKTIDSTIKAVRRIMTNLRPSVLDDLGLVSALEYELQDFEKRTGIRCELFPSVKDEHLDEAHSVALFRIFQEALTNVARHTGATEVNVRLRVDAVSSVLEVEDNGKGIEKRKISSSKSIGLLGMRERANTFGGRVIVTGTPGKGTTVSAEIPLVEKTKVDRDIV